MLAHTVRHRVAKLHVQIEDTPDKHGDGADDRRQELVHLCTDRLSLRYLRVLLEDLPEDGLVREHLPDLPEALLRHQKLAEQHNLFTCVTGQEWGVFERNV
jgi:hypothetical protein